jgi:hypothetical protein
MFVLVFGGVYKFVFQLAVHSLCCAFMSWFTFFMEHSLQGPVGNIPSMQSSRHRGTPWDSATRFTSAGLCESDSHTAHHRWPRQSAEVNRDWANSVAAFSRSQLRYGHLAWRLDSLQEELFLIPWLLVTKQYSLVRDRLFFRHPKELVDAGLSEDEVAAYCGWTESITEEHIQQAVRFNPSENND